MYKQILVIFVSKIDRIAYLMVDEDIFVRRRALQERLVDMSIGKMVLNFSLSAGSISLRRTTEPHKADVPRKYYR